MQVDANVTCFVCKIPSLCVSHLIHCQTIKGLFISIALTLQQTIGQKHAYTEKLCEQFFLLYKPHVCYTAP